MNRCLLLSLIFLFFYKSDAQTGVLKQIKVKGNNFITSDDKVFIFRGLNTNDPDNLMKNEHWNKAYFQEIKNWGANVVRFPIHPTAWRRQGKDKYLKMLDEGVNWAIELGIWAVITI